MAFSLIDHKTAAAAAGGTATTAAIDSSLGGGAKLLIIVATDYTHDSSTDTVADSKGNIYTALTNQASFNSDVCIWYCLNPSFTGAGHTARCTGAYTALSFSAWNAAGTVSFDRQNGAINNSLVSTIQPGSITPSGDGALVITGQAAFFGTTPDSTPTVSGFTLLDWRTAVSGNNVDNGVAYLVQSVAAPVNPTWSGFGQSYYRAAAIASFLDSGGGATFQPAWARSNQVIGGGGYVS